MALLYGYSLLYLLAGILAYELNFYQIFLVSGITFAAARLVFKNVTRFLIVLGVASGALIIGGYLLYRQEMLAETWQFVLDYLMVYGLSVSVSTLAIDLHHQTVLLLFVGFILMGILNRFMGSTRYGYIYLIAVSVVLVVIGYLGGTLGSASDRYAFLFLSCTLVIYFFYNYHRRFVGTRYAFGPFVITVAVFVVLIVGGARLLYSVDPRPLTSPPRATSVVINDELPANSRDATVISVTASPVIEIDERFDFTGTELFTIEGESTAYLKTAVYESYVAGRWQQLSNSGIDNGDLVQRSEYVEPLTYDDFYMTEQITITISDMITNAPPMANYYVVQSEFAEEVGVYRDINRGTYFTEQYMENGDQYSFEGVLPAYGNPSFEALAATGSVETPPVGLALLAGPVGLEHQAVAELAREVTDGIESPYEKALAIEEYLKSNYTYNVIPDPPGDGVDPLNHFLFETGEGFCQQFTTAFVVMARSVGIPARYAVGFYVSEKDVDPESYVIEFGEAYVDDGIMSVTDADAHTWPEVYFGEVGWIMMEPTPGRSFRVSDGITSLGQLEQEASEEDNQLVQVTYADIQEGLYAALGVLVLFLLVWLVRYKRSLGKRALNDKMLAYHQMHQMYHRTLGLNKEAFETVREFNVRTAASMPTEAGNYLAELTSTYEAAVYGDEILSEQAVAAYKAYYHYLRKYTGRKVGRLRRIGLRTVAFFRI